MADVRLTAEQVADIVKGCDAIENLANPAGSKLTLDVVKHTRLLAADHAALTAERDRLRAACQRIATHPYCPGPTLAGRYEEVIEIATVALNSPAPAAPEPS